VNVPLFPLNGGFKTARLFISLPISKEIREKCIAIQEGGRKRFASVRWGDPAQLHLTLVFLGELDFPEYLQVKEVVQDIANNLPPFSLKIARLGAFPEGQPPKLIWVGVSESPLLMAMQKKYKVGVAALGIPVEARPFQPHVTLGRVQKGGGAADHLSPWMKQEEDVQLGRCEMKEVMLMESELRPEGSLYKSILAAPLRG